LSLCPALGSSFTSRTIWRQSSTEWIHPSFFVLPHAPSLLADTTLLRNFHCSDLFLCKLHLGLPAFFLDFWPLKMGLICCLESSVRCYHYMLCNSPDNCSS
jgi:hypothetical protein